MGHYVLETMFRILSIRGHIPRFEGYDARRSGFSLAGGASPLLRALAAVAVTAVFLSLILWTAVWLVLTLL